MRYHVYILRNPVGRLYIGLTENVEVRLQQHNSGVSTWTRHRGPWELLWTKEFSTLSEAKRFETLLKKQKGGAGLYRLTELPRPRS
jgi:putative endonuclease